MRIPKPCLSVCLYPDCPSEEVTIASSILVLHWQLIHQWEGLHENSSMETQKFEKFSKKVRNSKFDLGRRVEKNLKFFPKNFEFWLVTKSWNHLSFVNISPTLAIDTSMGRSSRELQHGNPKIWNFFQKSSKFEIWLGTKSWNHPSLVNISPTLAIDASMERSSRELQHGNPKVWIFF